MLLSVMTFKPRQEVAGSGGVGRGEGSRGSRGEGVVTHPFHQ